MEGEDTENSIPWDGGGSASGKKKKERRKRNVSEIVYASLPEHAIIEKDEQVVAELEAAYRILQTINSIKHITPFYDEPTQDKFGMSSYFSIIKKPMWLNEVRRKIECGEYEGLHDFVADLHLILYNCYKFWGVTHRISFRGYIIEHKIETQLAKIPWSVREKMKCPVSTGDCIICDRNSNESFEDEDGTTKQDVISNPDLVYYNSKGYVSKIVNQLMNEVDEEIEPEEETEEAKEERLKMEKWEKETLNKLEGASEIPHMPELVDIGLFLKITHEVLNVEEMTQYEVERMLLIPLESATLQTLMTSILSPEWKRNNLDETPLMPYHVWNSRLRQRITSWLKIFHKLCDSIETFERLGIDPYFWNVVNLVNPMAADTDIPFHELPFYVRVWVFKTLLDNILHTNKTIVDVFLDESADPNRLRHAYLGKGLMNNHYKSVPSFLPEIRVYKEMAPLLSVWTSYWDDADDGIVKLQRNRMNFKEDTYTFCPNNKTFELVANDLESLNELINFGKFQNLQGLAAALTKFKEEVDTSHIRCEGLKSIYKQYHTFQSRTCEYFTNMENLWFSYKNDFNKPIKEEKKEVGDASETVVLGKRRNTPSKVILNMADGYSSESAISDNEQSESDISDWESSYKNHQRKKKLRPSKKAKLFKEKGEPPKEPPGNLTIPIENGRSLQEPEPIKVDTKESIFLTEFKMEPMAVGQAGSNDLTKLTEGNIKTEKDVGGPTIAATLSLGALQEDTTVLILSSDEEEDVKPTIAKLKLRDVSTLLESPPPPEILPNSSLNSPPNNMISNMPNNTVNSLPNNMMNNMVNTLNVVIPPMPVNSNPMMGVNPMMGMNRPMSVQVPPNLYQVRAPRQRMPQINPRQMMIRSPRSVAPRPQTSPRQVRMLVPKPITPKKPVPKPLLMSPQEWANTPVPMSTNTSPSRGRPAIGGSPRGRSPVTPPQQRMWSNNVGSPRNRSPIVQQGRGITPNKTTGIPPKALFPATDSEAAEGKLIMGPNETGTGYGYQIVLPDGGIRYLTDAEVSAIKRRNSGTLPRHVRIPPDGSFL